MVRLRKASVLLVGAPLVLIIGLTPADAHGPIGSAQIVDNSIQAVDIAANAVGASETAPNSVGISEIVTNGVGAAETAPNSVGLSEIVTNGVGSAEIATGAVGSAEIATGAVGGDELANGVVGSDALATGAVGSSEIATGAVGSSEIATGAVGEAELLDTIQIETSRTYSAAGSFQLLAADLTLASTAGTSDAGDADFLGATMGNVLGSNLLNTHNYVGGVIGHYSVTGTNASTYPVGAVLGGIGDGTTTADGAFVAYIDGDSALTTAGAAFKVMNNNSTPGSGFDFGVDLQDAAHDGYAAVDEDFYNKAPVRLVQDVVVLVDNGAPTSGVSGTGAGTAGKGSLYVDTTAGVLYINTGTLASPTWTIVGEQSGA